MKRVYIHISLFWRRYYTLYSEVPTPEPLVPYGISNFNRSYWETEIVAPWLPHLHRGYPGIWRFPKSSRSHHPVDPLHRGFSARFCRPDVSVSTVGCKQPIWSWEIRTSQKMPLSRDKSKFIYETWGFTWIYHSKKWNSSKKQKRFQQNSWNSHEKREIIHETKGKTCWNKKHKKMKTAI